MASSGSQNGQAVPEDTKKAMIDIIYNLKKKNKRLNPKIERKSLPIRLKELNLKMKGKNGSRLEDNVLEV